MSTTTLEAMSPRGSGFPEYGSTIPNPPGNTTDPHGPASSARASAWRSAIAASNPNPNQLIPDPYARLAELRSVDPYSAFEAYTGPSRAYVALSALSGLLRDARPSFQAPAPFQEPILPKPRAIGIARVPVPNVQQADEPQGIFDNEPFATPVAQEFSAWHGQALQEDKTDPRRTKLHYRGSHRAGHGRKPNVGLENVWQKHPKNQSPERPGPARAAAYDRETVAAPGRLRLISRMAALALRAATAPYPISRAAELQERKAEKYSGRHRRAAVAARIGTAAAAASLSPTTSVSARGGYTSESTASASRAPATEMRDASTVMHGRVRHHARGGEEWRKAARIRPVEVRPKGKGKGKHRAASKYRNRNDAF
jgi:hypothetical protein